MIKCCTCPACKGAFSLSLTPAFMRKAEIRPTPIFCPYCGSVLKLGGQAKTAKLHTIDPQVRKVLAEAKRKGRAILPGVIDED